MDTDDVTQSLASQDNMNNINTYKWRARGGRTDVQVYTTAADLDL